MRGSGGMNPCPIGRTLPPCCARRVCGLHCWDSTLIRGDGDALRNAMKAAAQTADVLVCDAETDDDLRKIAEASMALGRGAVWAGSAGLARHLLPAAGLSRTPVYFADPAAARGTGALRCRQRFFRLP